MCFINSMLLFLVAEFVCFNYCYNHDSLLDDTVIIWKIKTIFFGTEGWCNAKLWRWTVALVLQAFHSCCQISQTQNYQHILLLQSGQMGPFWVLTSLCWFPLSTRQGRKPFNAISWFCIPCSLVRKYNETMGTDSQASDWCHSALDPGKLWPFHCPDRWVGSWKAWPHSLPIERQGVETPYWAWCVIM